jgi:hypothetical protein
MLRVVTILGGSNPTSLLFVLRILGSSAIADLIRIRNILVEEIQALVLVHHVVVLVVEEEAVLRKLLEKIHC